MERSKTRKRNEVRSRAIDLRAREERLAGKRATSGRPRSSGHKFHQLKVDYLCGAQVKLLITVIYIYPWNIGAQGTSALLLSIFRRRNRLFVELCECSHSERAAKLRRSCYMNAWMLRLDPWVHKMMEIRNRNFLICQGCAQGQSNSNTVLLIKLDAGVQRYFPILNHSMRKAHSRRNEKRIDICWRSAENMEPVSIVQTSTNHENLLLNEIISSNPFW